MLKSGLTILLTASLAAAQSYTYDDAGRLIQAAYPNGAGVAYTYDDADNLTAAKPLSLPASPTGLEATRTAPGTVALTWQNGGGAASNGVLVYRQVVGSAQWELLTTLNATQTTYSDGTLDSGLNYIYRIAARGANGLSSFTSPVTPSTSASLNLTIASGGVRTLATVGTSPQVQTGYATAPVESGSTPYGTAVFSFRQNGVTVSEVGVPVSPPTTRARIFVDYRQGVKSASNQYSGTITVTTGLALVNPGAGAANLVFTLRGPTGATLASGVGSLDAGAHVSLVIDQLSSIAPAFHFPADFPATAGAGTLEVESDLPVSIVALRATTNEVGTLLFTSTPVADLTADSSNDVVHFPHFAEGGGFSTALILMNTSGAAETGTLQLLDDNGAGLTVKPVNGAAGSLFAYQIPAGGVYVFESDGSSAETRSGSVRVTPSVGTASPVGAGTFRLATPQGLVITESGIPSALATTHARLFVDKTEGHDTGIAIALPGSQAATVSVQAFQTDGAAAPGAVGGSFTIQGNGHRANVAADLLPGLPANFIGVLDVSSATPFVALTLRALVNQRNELLLSTIPVADLTRPAPAPLIFPHLADGGGFQTQLILLGPISPATAVVKLFDERGAPLGIVKLP